MTKRLLPLLAFALLLFVTSCGEDEDPIIDNEEEVITQVTLTLFPNGPQEQVTLGFNDPDGDGGNDPEFSQMGALIPNASYRGQVSFANVEEGSIDGEIVDEGLEHQVFYQTAGGLNMGFTYTDFDTAAQPIGLMTTVTTGDTGAGTLTITLKHEPNKVGAVIDNSAAVGGETDVEVSFAVDIQ